MRYVAVIFLCGLLSSTAFAGESYLCIADLATGFAFDKKQGTWGNTNFKPTGKYLVSKAMNKESNWEIKEVGDSMAFAFCKDDFSENGSLPCGGFYEFRMNRNTLRFLRAYLIGYWTDGPKSPDRLPSEGADTPAIHIGKCSPL